MYKALHRLMRELALEVELGSQIPVCAGSSDLCSHGEGTATSSSSLTPERAPGIAYRGSPTW